MRKWRMLSALLAVLLAAGLGISAAHVQAAGRNVTFDETMLEGNASDFDGLQVQAQYSFDGCLHWDVGYDPGRGSTKSALRYDPPHGMPKAQEGFWLTTGLGGMESYSSDEPLDPGIEKMIDRVRENAPSKVEPYSAVEGRALQRGFERGGLSDRASGPGSGRAGLAEHGRGRGALSRAAAGAHGGAGACVP